ncbi:hypothetical protein OG819_54190 [Streptomyces sp. NBC_01549]|uniref:hypothetical protein n=1 Tax=Streptomyces sp. NBC_01549 TaxID=2975874 RepID=UPI002252E266|nr:hypothetical protein [Streptomyces sp. NBC_01549]MCX4598128.1 hypothetical protein [Streptomyces sp. NBC_01549]
MPGLRASVVEQARAAGLTVEYIDERPDEPAMGRRFYPLRQPHEAELRRELGDDQAAREDELVLPRLATREAVAVTLRRPSGGGWGHQGQGSRGGRGVGWLGLRALRRVMGNDDGEGVRRRRQRRHDPRQTA